MTRIESAVVAIGFACCLTANAYAQQKACGSGWTEYFVPDSVQALCVGFQQSCVAHDTCYGVCTQADVGKPGCEVATRSMRRLSCDSDFLKNMDKVCISHGTGTPVCKAACRVVANFYYGTLRLLGGVVSGFRGETASDGQFLGPILPAGISAQDPKGIGSMPEDDMVQSALSFVMNNAQVDKLQPVTAGVAGGYAVFVFGRAPTDSKLSFASSEQRVVYANAVDLTDVRFIGDAVPATLAAAEKRALIAKRLSIAETELSFMTYPAP